MALFIVLLVIAVLTAIFVGRMNFHFKTVDTRLWLGLETLELTPQIKQQYNIHSSNGLLVARVFMGSPAEASGIKDGDVIRRWNGVTVTSQEQFQYLIQTADADNRVKITVERNDIPVIVYGQVGIRPGGM